jgi:hypothetical protein
LTIVSHRVKLEPSSDIIKRMQRALKEKRHCSLIVEDNQRYVTYRLGFAPVLNSQMGTPVYSFFQSFKFAIASKSDEYNVAKLRAT